MGPKSSHMCFLFFGFLFVFLSYRQKEITIRRQMMMIAERFKDSMLQALKMEEGTLNQEKEL